ncbi:MAG TPA: carboxypeptidase-like regulatory domain-containing protein [Terriglobales bacterium]|nr:carboxypeptidase-like regulatory domain-containing protein [Terriglobales bacterium]
MSTPKTPAPLTAKPAELCTLEGRVLAADTGEPLRKARVIMVREQTLTPQTPGTNQAAQRMRQFVATTDQEGHFIFKELDSGRYTLSATRNGYAQQYYGATAANRPGTPLTLAPGSNTKDIALRMTRAAVISGRVLDNDGEPLSYVGVQAMQYGYQRGQRMLRPRGYGQTDDRGMYRIHDLPPGKYYVSATYRDPGQVEFVRDGTVSTEADMSYPTTYYPATTDAASAQAMLVRAGEEQEVDFQLVPQRAVSVRGRVINAATGKPAINSSVFVLPRSSITSGFFGNFSSTAYVQNAEGEFQLRGILPGAYVLMTQQMDEGKRYSAYMNLDVGTQDVEGVQLVLSAGSTIEGQVRIEGPPLPAGRPPVTVLLTQATFLPLSGFGGSARVKDDGSFVIENLGQGSYRVNVNNAGETSYLKSVRMGNQDLLDKELVVQTGAKLQPLEIVVSQNAGAVQGAVEDGDHKPWAGAQVVLVPERKNELGRLFASGRSDQYGHFSVRGITPGKYRVYAFEQIEAGAWQDPEFMRKYEDRGSRVEIGESSQPSLTLKLIPASETSADQ